MEVALKLLDSHGKMATQECAFTRWDSMKVALHTARLQFTRVSLQTEPRKPRGRGAHLALISETHNTILESLSQRGALAIRGAVEVRGVIMYALDEGALRCMDMSIVGHHRADRRF